MSDFEEDINNLSNITQAYEKTQLAYSIYHYAIFGLGLIPIFLSFYLFVIKKQHKTMKHEFAPLMSHMALACFVYSLDIVLWQPIDLTQINGGYSSGVWKFLGQDGYLVGYWISWSMLNYFGIIISLTNCIRCYRLNIIKNRLLLDLFDWLLEKDNLWHVLNSAFVINFLLTIPPMLSWRFSGKGYLASQINEMDDPKNLSILQKHPDLYASPDPQPLLHQIFDYTFLSLILFHVLFCITNIAWTWQYVYGAKAKDIGQFLTKKTLKMQKRFYWENFARIIMVILFLFAPLIVELINEEVFEKHELLLTEMFCQCLMVLHSHLQMLITYLCIPSVRNSNAVMSVSSRFNLNSNSTKNNNTTRANNTTVIVSPRVSPRLDYNNVVTREYY